MRIRSTKPEFWSSKTIAALPWDVRLVLKGLESYVDDNGVGKDDLALIAADVFPRDLVANPRETLARLSEAISDLAEAGLVVRYEWDGEDLLYIDRWKKQQRIDKPAKGRFRRPDGTLEYGEDVNRESYAKSREDVASPPETLAPGTGEQGNRGTDNSCASSELEREFAEWYDVYPRKRDKGHAAKAYRAARKKVSAEVLLTAVQQQRTSLTAKGVEFCPYPATWLKGERWTDETHASGPVGDFPTNGTEEEKDAWVRAQPLPTDGAYYGGSLR